MPANGRRDLIRRLKVNENPSNESRVVYAGGQTYGHVETTVTFRNFANCPKNGRYSMVW